MDIVTLKKKIRKLKKLEVEIRFRKNRYCNQPLLWDKFFDFSEKRNVKYPISYLLTIDNDEYRKIADEFLAFVYSDLFKHLDIHSYDSFDKSLLLQLGLPYDADTTAIKKRFRQLAKQYHPDTGGDEKKFKELMEIYNKLIKEKK